MITFIHISISIIIIKLINAKLRKNNNDHWDWDFFFNSNIKIILKEENSTIIIPSMFSSCVVILSFANNDGSAKRIKSFVHSEGIVFRTTSTREAC